MDSGYLDNTPVVPAPPGQTPNFTDPVSRGYQLVVVIVITMVLIVLFLASRLYVRLRLAKSLSADDFLWKPGGGILGIHFWDVPLSHYIEFEKGSVADSVLIRICNTLIKVGFLAFYLRLFGTLDYVRIIVWIMMAVVITFCIVFVILDLVFCLPWPSEHDGFMDPGLQARCNKYAPNLVTAGAYFSVITDFFILLIPMHRVPTLKIPQNRKWGLSFIFLTGLLACGAGLTNLIIRSDKKVFVPADFTWTIIPVYITSLVEINVGLMCLSMPVIIVPFVGRLKRLGNSLSSWIKERREGRVGSPSSSESYRNLATPSDGISSPQLPEVPSDNAILTGMRTFVRNIYRSGAATQNSMSERTVLPTFNELTIADLSYHHQLKSMQPGSSKPTSETTPRKTGPS